MVSDTIANMFLYAQLNSLNAGRSLLGLPACADLSVAGSGMSGFFACDLPTVGLVSQTFQFGVLANLQGLSGLTFNSVPSPIMHRDIAPIMRSTMERPAADWPQIDDKDYRTSIKAGKRSELGQNLSSFNKPNSGGYNSHPMELYLTKQRPPGKYRGRSEAQGGTTPTS